MEQSVLERGFENEDEENKKVNKFTLVRDVITKYLFHRLTILTIITICFSVITPILVFYYLLDVRNVVNSKYNHSCLVTNTYRIPCGKENESSFLQCNTISCCYDIETNECFHSVPSKYYYHGVNRSSSQKLSPFRNLAFSKLNLKIDEINEHRLQIGVTVDDFPGSNEEHEALNNNYTYYYRKYNNSLGIEVYRAETDELILTTFNGPLIASDGYWEWSFYLTKESLHGLGEVVFRNNETVTKVIYKNRNDHNTVPIFMARTNGKYHGLIIKHEGPLEVKVLPSNLIIARSLAGNHITFELCTGPSPRDVREQQRTHSPKKIPYWILGAHVCRDGSTSIQQAIDEFKKFDWKGIKYESDCIHESLYALLGEITDTQELKKLIQDLQARNSHFVMSISPQILKTNEVLYNRAIELKVIHMNRNNQIYNGSYLGKQAIYLDFEHSSINDWMVTLNTILSDITFDGFVFRDNWPQDDNYVFINEGNKFPYITLGINSALTATLPWHTTTMENQKAVQHILKHNQYGSSQVNVFNKSISVDLTMSASFDRGMSSGAHIQNIDITWKNFKKAVISSVYHGVFESPLISIPICGSTKDYDENRDEDLCIRWYLAAATFPIYRVSSDKPRRDLSSLESNFASRLANNALKNRHKLLLYYYTTLNSDEPLLRPMFYDFYFDKEACFVEGQYMLGDSLLVAQPFEPGLKDLRIYLPPSVSVWYEFWGGRTYNSTGWTNFSMVATDWIMFMKEGSIIPLRNAAKNKAVIGDYSRDDTMDLVVAMSISNNSIPAKGFLLFESAKLIFEANSSALTIQNIKEVRPNICENNQQEWPSKISKALIYNTSSLISITNFEKIIDICLLDEDQHSFQFATE